MTTSASTANADAVVEFAAASMTSVLPDHVLEAARFAIVDWFGVAIGAGREKPVQAVHSTVSSWRSAGGAQVLLAGRMAPATASLINGTMAHCLDFDDTHVRSISHLSGPTWAAAFALGTHLGKPADEVVRAFLVGFEAGGRLGAGGFGVAVNERRIHATGVFGCIGATVAASALLGLTPDQMKNAIGLAATQAAGLTDSFGTSGKPFHAGKAAFNGVLAAELARDGFDGALGLIEPDGGMSKAFVQDRAHAPLTIDFAEGWEITRNTIKPYAACLLTHPVIDSARQLHTKLRNEVAGIDAIRLKVNPLTIQIAGKPHPQTPFEGKFSLAFCAALGLTGRRASQGDFSDATVADRDLLDLVSRVVLEPVPDMDLRAATVELTVAGTTVAHHTPMALGNPERPISWGDMEEKFTSLVEPMLGPATNELFARLRRIDHEADLSRIADAVNATASQH